METTNTATLLATVISVQSGSLLVCSRCDRQQILVQTADACSFSCGDCVCVVYNGVMTASIPPQISADSISRVSCC